MIDTTNGRCFPPGPLPTKPGARPVELMYPAPGYPPAGHPYGGGDSGPPAYAQAALIHPPSAVTRVFFFAGWSIVFVENMRWKRAHPHQVCIYPPTILPQF